jgi:integrase
MPRVANRLTARKVDTIKTPARLADGLGLYLVVEGEFSKNWVFEYQFNGKRRYMGLGSALDVSLADAREKRNEYRKLKANGVDPLEQKRATRAAQALTAAKAVTFKEAATRYMDANRAGWDKRHALQWQSTLEQHAFPKFGDLPVGAVDEALVLAVLQPILTTANVTATRLRGRIESVLDWAKAMKLREGENPARWRGHLEKLLMAPKRAHRIKNLASMPFGDVPEFMQKLRSQSDVVAAAAMQFLILTAGRKNEVVEAKWDEIDLNKAVWTVPAERMKKRIEHQVPLSRAAVDILERMQKSRINEYVFFATIRGTKRISDAVLGRLMDAMGCEEFVPHGFRSSFRSWAGAKTNFQREVAEAALAHKVGDQTEQSYQRDNLIEKRRLLMDAWAAFATSDPERSADVLTFAPIAAAN